ncbi:MAG: hemin receptor [Flavobacteriales bacterium]|nr:MAG: hemin receptor [Flavobacteriales bacterium]
MKKLFLIGGLLVSTLINAQSIGYGDAAVLFGTEEINGTSRFNAMSGAFGSLGGDLSAGDINPAGLAVFSNSEAAFTIGFRNTNLSTSYYGTNTDNNDDYLTFAQAGGVLVFGSPKQDNWNKFALGFNYSLVKDFENNYNINGNSGISDFNSDPFLNNDNNPNNDVFYENVNNQFFGNFTKGENSKFTLSFAAKYNENLSLGVSLISHRIDFYQRALFEESNNDGNGNLLDASLLHELSTYGSGAGLNFGLIAKPIYELRIGLAVQTPIWYNLTDEFANDLEIKVSNNSQLYRETSDVKIFDYNLKTPAKATASIAYLFGSDGLISLDYTYKNTKNTKLKPGNEFVKENDFLSANLKNSSAVRVGAEWRIGKMMSLRGGFHYIESPYKDAVDSDHIKGFSVGTGFKFGRNVKLDLAYLKSQKTDIYNFTNASNAADLDINHNRITATLAFNF